MTHRPASALDPVLPGLDPGSLVEVAVPVPLRRRFTYRLPPHLEGAELAPGTRVAVPFGRRKVSGFLLGRAPEPPPDGVDVATVAGVLDDDPPFPDELLRFLGEAADYYLHPVGEVLRAAAPSLPSQALAALRGRGVLERDSELGSDRLTRRRTWRIRRVDRSPGESDAEARALGPRQRALLDALGDAGEAHLDALRGLVNDPRTVARSLERRGLVTIDDVELLVDPFLGPPVQPDVPPSLNASQAGAVDAIATALAEGGKAGFLLQGVTGSGKTEVYLRAIEACRRTGRGALVLVPEIALTPQLVARFRARFGDRLAVIHSGIRRRERDDAWRALRSGRIDLAVGARSALFAPVPDLGLVVVDEEHDPSFKQEEGFRYHARDLALLRADRAGAVALLGSATPSLESRALAERGKLTRLLLPDRATQQPLPPVTIVDLGRHRAGPSGHPLLSAPLHRALEATLGRGGQAILFLNRRGFAPSLRCEACGEVPGCPACSVALTEHKRLGLLRCHYCDFRTRTGEACPSCGALALERIGLGTERLEGALAETFAPARVARLDRDTATNPRKLEGILDRFRRREIDVLVGTQMVTKGHDLPGVTLVGVVLADQSLAFPDFRAAERTFQLL
ncbi:MAG TPA: primosomal protein N', partial [Polyangiaceae bacterium LLY-WYZ-14_1]|nr:primosomal protein N' [Polyangiaceae bacterium LLY-WYZ-14_1]